jgi:hypothetical protein
MSCNGQLDLGAVAADQSGALDDPAYIAGGPDPSDASAEPGGTPDSANVAVLSVSAAASILSQYVSLNVAPGGLGEPGSLQYLLSTHTLVRVAAARRPACPVEALTGLGDQAMRMTGPHPQAEHERQFRAGHKLRFDMARVRVLDTAASWTRTRLIAFAKRRLGL